MRHPLVAFGCHRFMPFQDREEVELRPLTLVFGRNSAGKSALVRLPRLILGALAGRHPHGVPLDLPGGPTIAEHFLDLVHERDFFGAVGFEGTLQHADEELAVSWSTLNLKPHEDRSQLRRWSARGAVRGDATLGRGPDGTPVLSGTSLDGLLPQDPAAQPWRDLAQRALAGVEHLGPLRAQLEPAYVTDRSPALGFDGAGAAQVLEADDALAARVATWFRDHMDGWSLEPTSNGESFTLELVRGSTRVNARRGGQGVHQVLPVVVQQLARQAASDSRLSILEQPELHLHDAAQAPLGDLLCDTARADEHRGKQDSVLVETHSEALFLRVRRRIAEGLFPAEDLAVYYVGPREPGDSTRVHRVQVAPDGSLDWWPHGVFLERYEEVRHLQRAQRQ